MPKNAQKWGFSKFSRKRLQRFFRFYAWSSCPIVGRNWRSQISQEKSGSFKNGPNVVKNDGFSPLLTIYAHVWHFSSSDMGIQASLIILHKLDEKECHFLADFAFWLQSICENWSKLGKIQCFLTFDWHYWLNLTFWAQEKQNSEFQPTFCENRIKKYAFLSKQWWTAGI